MIVIENVSKSYGEQPILDHLHFQLSKGQFAFLQGKSGSGKSTLLKMLYREVEAEAGSIWIDGSSIQDLPKHVLRRQMGIIFQSFELIEQKTVFENIALAGRVVGKSVHEIEQEAMRLLTRVGLAHKKDVFPTQLSGGQQQRVAIVRALLNKPKLLLADEPTGNLDKETALEILQLLKELHEEEQMTMLIVTHSEHLVEGYEASHWVMEAGKIHESC